MDMKVTEEITEYFQGSNQFVLISVRMVLLQKVLQYTAVSVPLSPAERRNTFSTPPSCGGVCLPFVLQYASHEYRNTSLRKMLVVGGHGGLSPVSWKLACLPFGGIP